ncbi:hypothetical protein BKA62DRAFT_97973 [Auriculariales sp. MPI-PUGE-AT-0066]|nr:hypothetical protein BKA62DRAFT_97973 [Auriculariales sp. MPI-PUGE-AT-0066]
MSDSAGIGMWLAGENYGPALPPLHLYQLKAPLKIHPCLTALGKGPSLMFNLRTGECAAMAEDRQLVELHGIRREPATHPRVQQLYLIMDRSPWFTLCENEEGVTIGDIINAVARDYRKFITTDEWARLTPVQQERIRRSALSGEYARQEQHLQQYHRETQPPQNALVLDNRPYRRSLWLMESYFVEHWEQNEKLAQARLGFSSPDVLVMIMGS